MHKTILQAVVGSTAHGIAVQDGLEDLDLMSIVVEDARTFVGFYEKSDSRDPDAYTWVQRESWLERTKPEGVRSEAGDIDHVIYGLRKYIKLALRGNPSVLLPLFVSTPRICTLEGTVLRSLVPALISKRVFPAFQGYMNQQHKRLMGTAGQKNVTRPELIAKYGYDTKYAAHVVRLGFQGCELLRTGRLTLPMHDSEQRLCRDVRNGQYRLDQVDGLITNVKANLELEFSKSRLPEQPDRATVTDFVHRTYEDHWRQV